METLDIEKLQQELQKLGHDRLDPNDPLFMDHLARRLELQWHYTKIQDLLDDQQNKINISQAEFSESMRKAYSEWINEGGSHLKSCIEAAGSTFLEKVSLTQPERVQPSPFHSYWIWISILLAFGLGLFLGGRFL